MIGKWIAIPGVGLILIGCGAAKLLYIGWEDEDLGEVGTYKVRAYETVHELNPLALLANDARGGYYRVFDREGRKVFEVFSKGFAFDVVLTGEDQVEFQLGSGETRIWKVPHNE